LEKSLQRKTAELKSFIEGLDTYLLKKALEWARKTYRKVIEKVDDIIAEERQPGYSIGHRREVWYQTCIGAVRIKRRQYRDGSKGCHYLLDEIAGMGKYQHITQGVKELALDLATEMPYRKSAEILRKTSAIELAHQTIWRIVGKTADPYLRKAEQATKRFLETGEIPDSEGRQVGRLLVEADGVMLSLQREKERKAEVKLGIAYEGWEKVGKDRYRTVNKTAFADVAGQESFWAGMSLRLQRKYDLGAVGETIVGGDGAAWVKEGASYFNGHFQLDRYHLNRELLAALGRDSETLRKIRHACDNGHAELGLQIIARTLQNACGQQAMRIAKTYHYLENNVSGLGDYRLASGAEAKELRRTGAIEGNIDKLVVRRMKNQGMSWTVKGIRRLLCVRFLVLEGRLKDCLTRECESDTRIKIPRKNLRNIVNNFSYQEPDAWLQGRLPALYGPHSSKPWVKNLKIRSEMIQIW
jgi:hypothetical protein